MKITKFPALVCSVALLGLAACSSPPPPKTVTITSEQSEQTVNLHKGDTLRVLLDGNPATGYVWTLLPPTSAVMAARDGYDFRPTTSALGSPGIFTFLLNAVTAGSQRLEFVYKSPAGKDETPQKACAFNVQVSADN